MLAQEKEQCKELVLLLFLFLFLLLVALLRWLWCLRRWSSRLSILGWKVHGEEVELSFELLFSKLVILLQPPSLNENILV